MDSSVKSKDLSLNTFESFLQNLSDINKVEFFSIWDEKIHKDDDFIDGLIKKNIIPKVTEKEIEQSSVKGIRKFVEKYNLLTSSIEKFECTPEYETFKFNCEKVQMLDSITSISYKLSEIVSSDIPDILESILTDEEDIDSYLEDLKKCRPLFDEQLLVQVVQNLEVYIYDILRVIYNREMKKLIINDKKKREKTVKYKDIFDCDDINDIHRLIVDEEIRENQSWKRVIGLFNDKKKLNIRFDDSGFSLRDLNELIETRHVVIHRKGVVDEKYVECTKDRSYHIGDRLRITHKMYIESLNNVVKLVKFIDKTVVDRYV